MAKKRRDAFDETVSRILLFLLGSVALSCCVFTIFTELEDSLALTFAVVLALIGIPLLLVSFFGKKSTAIKWAENTGNHEVMFIFVFLAIGIAAYFR